MSVEENPKGGLTNIEWGTQATSYMSRNFGDWEGWRLSEAGEDATPKNRSGTTQSVTAAEPEDIFKPNEWTVFSWAHQMVLELVMKEGPYRTKLLDLAQHSIARFWKTRGLHQHQFAPDGVVAEAWLSVCFLWADPLTEQNLRDDGSCAYTSMGEAGEAHFPIIAFSSAFKANDFPSGHSIPDNLTMDQAKTLLFFFRKLKHEFLHVVHGFIEIKYKKFFLKAGTPEKYTPHKQSIGRRTAAPQIGDHDEEEDSGGPILPLQFHRELSSTNPLCLYFGHKYLPLSDMQVLGLLQLGLYMVPVPDGPHNTLRTPFTIHECRAVAMGVLNADFYDRDGVTPHVHTARAASLETDDTDDTELEAWRRLGNIPIQIPEHFLSSRERQRRAN